VLSPVSTKDPEASEAADPVPKNICYQRRRHAARWTRDFLFQQLIPYIGNKRKLLPLVYRSIRATGVKGGTFLDLFSGSGVVARLAKVLGFRVIANDWEPYSFEINQCFIKCNHASGKFELLGGMNRAFQVLNRLEPAEGYITTHYCPRDDQSPDPDRVRMFFTRYNGGRIEAIREQIEQWSSRGVISRLEKSLLLAPLIYATSYVSNTSGVFKAYHRGWGGRNGTALYRILSRLALVPPVFYSNGNQAHRVYCEDALKLVEKLPPVAVAYVDPPYNQHQYGSNYHLLNTVALWDKPQVNPAIRAGRRTKDKSAIRKDWRQRRSRFCCQGEAEQELFRLIKGLKARFVLLSYSTDGIMLPERLVEILAGFGKVELVAQRYKRYRVSSTRPSPRPHNLEFVLILEKGAQPQHTCEQIVGRLYKQAEV
jgi:adenine-specific DNA-methyltransferase